MALALTVLIGGSLLLFPVGGSVTRLSFDLPFAWRSDLVGTVANLSPMTEIKTKKQPAKKYKTEGRTIDL